ncbi:MAG: YfiR family protein [Limisphaerales bacterium]
MKNRAINAVVALFSVMVAVGFNCQAQNSRPTKYQIEAAFIYNFARFVDWPTQAFARASSPLVIGVLGKNRFGADLAKTINDKVIRGHPLKFRECASLPDAMRCQVLFISDSEKGRLSKIISTLGAGNILTVGEMDNFIDQGGMINLTIIDQKVRFEINNSAAKAAGLTISSKLLSLAIKVK